MFKHGGVLSITSRILIVDMLNSKLDLAQITGIVVLHAEEYVTSLPPNFFHYYYYFRSSAFV